LVLEQPRLLKIYEKMSTNYKTAAGRRGQSGAFWEKASLYRPKEGDPRAGKAPRKTCRLIRGLSARRRGAVTAIFTETQDNVRLYWEGFFLDP
jgi:hypothetical protein